jgi:hypothetical protein
MEHIEIPTSVTQDAMMKQLCLSCPEYKRKSIPHCHYEAIPHCHYEAEVFFYPLVHFLKAFRCSLVKSYYPEETLEAVDNNAAC